MSDFEFVDNTGLTIDLLNSAISEFLEEAGAECETQAARNTRVKTGQTKGSFDHKVNEDAVYIGSDYDNAIYEEFGTGEYALYGNGRKTPWKYQDADGNWHTTTGKKGTRALFKAGQIMRPKLQGMLANKLREKLK